MPLYLRAAGKAVLLAVLLSTGATARAVAQTIQVNAGGQPTARVLPGGRLKVPVIVDLASAAALDIAALTVALDWSAAVLTFDSLRAAPGVGWSFTPSITGATTGNASFSTEGTFQLPATSPVANIFFTAKPAASGTRVTPGVTSATNASHDDILGSIRPRRLDVCVAVSGKWGDVTNDSLVNIIDAQQIARFSVGLTSLDPNSIGHLGDVTNDGSVNIIDAQQIARFSVLLPASPRTGTESYVAPAVSSATMTPASEQRIRIHETLQLTATPLTPETGSVAGCESFIWSSSNPAVASVNGTGFVTALSPGSATITATALSNPGVSVTSPIIVEDPSLIRVTVTNAGRAAKQYIAEVTGGGFADARGFTLNGLNMHGGVLEIPVPSTGTYSVHIVAIDAGSSSNPIVAAGGSMAVNVAASGVIERTLVLTAPVYTMITIPSAIRLGAALTVAWRIADPSNLIDGAARGVLFCGTIHTSINSLVADFGGTQSDACGVTVNGSGTLTYSNATTPVSPQTVPGTLKLQVRGSQFVRTGVGPASDIVAHWLSPSVTRGESPQSINVHALTVLQISPETPAIPGGTRRQMSVEAQDVFGVVTGLPVTWTSLAPSIASVTPGGLVTGLNPGPAVITATVATKTTSTTVSITAAVPIGSITVDPMPALTGNAMTTATAVVRDMSGVVIPDVAIAWQSTNSRVARINADGTIEALGAGSTQIVASSGAVLGSATLTVHPTPQAFGIVLRPKTPLATGVAGAFSAAAQRWSEIIRGDVTDIALINTDISVCLDETPGTTVLNEGIDDVVIYSNVKNIDGSGGILAEAGPCVIRGVGGQTLVGVMTFDAADIPALEADGSLQAVVLHEMGHVLGIGTNWGSLLKNPSPAPGAGDPTFAGANAQWAFARLGTGYAGVSVPVENCCGAGNRNVHWRESVLLRELMTGFITPNGDVNPLSPLTAASLVDIGYVVDVNQSDFPPLFLRGSGASGSSPVPINERVRLPEFSTAPDGRSQTIRADRAPIRAPTLRRND
jgi:uncharacterized protein YjdB